MVLPHERGRLLDAEAFQAGEDHLLLPAVVAFGLFKEPDHLPEAVQLTAGGLQGGRRLQAPHQLVQGVQGGEDGLMLFHQGEHRMRPGHLQAAGGQAVAQHLQVQVAEVVADLRLGHALPGQFPLQQAQGGHVQHSQQVAGLLLALLAQGPLPRLAQQLLQLLPFLRRLGDAGELAAPTSSGPSFR